MPLHAWSLSIPSLAATGWSALAPTFVILVAGETPSRVGNGARRVDSSLSSGILAIRDALQTWIESLIYREKLLIFPVII
jgi:hypothetical protein